MPCYLFLTNITYFTKVLQGHKVLYRLKSRQILFLSFYKEGVNS